MTTEPQIDFSQQAKLASYWAQVDFFILRQQKKKRERERERSQAWDNKTKSGWNNEDQSGQKKLPPLPSASGKVGRGGRGGLYQAELSRDNRNFEVKFERQWLPSMQTVLINWILKALSWKESIELAKQHNTGRDHSFAHEDRTDLFGTYLCESYLHNFDCFILNWELINIPLLIFEKYF